MGAWGRGERGGLHPVPAQDEPRAAAQVCQHIQAAHKLICLCQECISLRGYVARKGKKCLHNNFVQWSTYKWQSSWKERLSDAKLQSMFNTHTIVQCQSSEQCVGGRQWQHSEMWWPRLFCHHAPIQWDDYDKDYSDLPPQVSSAATSCTVACNCLSRHCCSPTVALMVVHSCA